MLKYGDFNAEIRRVCFIRALRSPYSRSRKNVLKRKDFKKVTFKNNMNWYFLCKYARKRTYRNPCWYTVWTRFLSEKNRDYSISRWISNLKHYDMCFQKNRVTTFNTHSGEQKFFAIPLFYFIKFGRGRKWPTYTLKSTED